MIKKVIPTLLVLFLATSSLLAQRGNRMAQMDPDEFAKDQIEALSKVMDLSEDQITELTPILKDTATKQKELFASMRAGNIERGDMRGLMGEITENQSEKFSTILSEEQMAKYKEMQEKRRKEGGRRGGRRGQDRGTH